MSAVFSTFGPTPDRDGDIVLPSAFTPGQAVPLCWAHDWAQPVGRGQIEVTPNEAIFNGRFFTETAAGMEAYKTVKAMSADPGLQEWSWGFKVLAGDPGVVDGQDVFYIRSAEVFEVSPVLVGAGIDTRTTAIKSAKYMGGGEPPDGSFEALSEDLADAFQAQQVPAGTEGYCWVLATWSNHFIACLSLGMSEDATYWDVPYVVNADGSITLGTATEVDEVTTFVPVTGKGIEYGLHAARVESAVTELLARSKAGLAVRAHKEGRAISDARRARMASVSGTLRTAADEIDAMLTETAPPAKAVDLTPDLRREFLKFQHLRMQAIPVGV